MEPLQPGDPHRVGAYQLLARLGAGGMGVVYLGRSLGGRTVAVKVIRERFASDFEFRARFRREVYAARKVTGALTAAVLDADPEAAVPWLATAYLPGLSLREAVGTFGGLPPGAVRTLATGLAEALADIHRAGLAHRDLKPGNIMLTGNGPRVIDFGIARPEDATMITQVGAVMGTPGFMSPEQASGGVAGPASDVFSFGAVLVFAATGRELFGAGATTATPTPHRVQNGRADLGGITDPWLYELVTACLRVHPGQRPSAAQLLDRIGEGAEPVEGTGTGWLPAPLAEEIDRRAARARQLPESPTVEPAAPMAALSAEPSRMSEATVEPAVVSPAAEVARGSDAGGPRTPAGSRRLSRRTLLIGGSVAIAGASGVAALVRSGTLSRAAPTSTPTSSSSSAPATATAPPPQAVVRWKVKVSDYYPDVFTAGGVVLARAQEDEMHALDPLTGKVLWTLPTTLTGVVTGDRVFVAQSINPRLTAVDPASGATRWTYRPSASEVPLSVVDNGSVTCFGYEKLRALGAADGKLRWAANVSAKLGLAADGDLVVAVDETELVGLDAGNGRTRWTYPLAEGANAGQDPLISDGLVFVNDLRGTLHAVRADNGTIAWRKPEFHGRSVPVSRGGMLYAGGGKGEVFAIRAAIGDVRWSRRLDHASVLRLSGDTLYAVSTDRTLYALNAADSRIMWTYEADMNKQSAPGIAAGLVFIGTREGNVEALVPPDGGPRAGT